MSDPITRFSSRVANYVKYRPRYPRQFLDLLAVECGLKPESLVADIGSGTGILSQSFLQFGNRVYSVEPNPEMRMAAERLLKDYSNFNSMAGKAEATTLADTSVDFITAAQAFHWFDRRQARVEFERILRPGGWVVLIWNERRLDGSAFLRDFESLFLKYGTDYERVRHENTEPDIALFFAPGSFELASFENSQQLNLSGLTGRVLSASYAPEPDHQYHAPMLNELGEIFSTYQIHGTVTIEYDTRVYYGHLNETTY